MIPYSTGQDIQEETAEACDWLQGHVTIERDIIGTRSSGGAGTERVSEVS